MLTINGNISVYLPEVKKKEIYYVKSNNGNIIYVENHCVLGHK